MLDLTLSAAMLRGTNLRPPSPPTSRVYPWTCHISRDHGSSLRVTFTLTTVPNHHARGLHCHLQALVTFVQVLGAGTSGQARHPCVSRWNLLCPENNELEHMGLVVKDLVLIADLWHKNCSPKIWS
ncbi:hypothetical protein RRG08_038197 [Elysia crispata]|uniref:Uncharacterized protein n=1 Tax=Elysia crispata TaxID=231223 RepID=A0AAE1AP27_9GAST|nr:hypothetical protein RRG08_038197 [Elysia crispata]